MPVRLVVWRRSKFSELKAVVWPRLLAGAAGAARRASAAFSRRATAPPRNQVCPRCGVGHQNKEYMGTIRQPPPPRPPPRERHRRRRWAEDDNLRRRADCHRSRRGAEARLRRARS